MIYTTADINEKQKFEELLDKTRDLVLKNLDPSINSGNKFEILVFDCMRHYVAPAQNQSNKKADIPPFFNKLG